MLIKYSSHLQIKVLVFLGRDFSVTVKLPGFYLFIQGSRKTNKEGILDRQVGKNKGKIIHPTFSVSPHFPPFPHSAFSAETNYRGGTQKNQGIINRKNGYKSKVKLLPEWQFPILSPHQNTFLADPKLWQLMYCHTIYKCYSIYVKNFATFWHGGNRSWFRISELIFSFFNCYDLFKIFIKKFLHLITKTN